jgi:hypothetical protein
MVKGMFTGVLEDVASLSDVAGTCQADACTWDPYQTLAVCVSVADVSTAGLLSNSLRDVPRVLGTAFAALDCVGYFLNVCPL